MGLEWSNLTSGCAAAGNKLSPRYNSDDGQIDAKIDDGNKNDTNYDGARDSASGLSHLVTDITDIVISQVVVNTDPRGGAQAKKKAQRKVESSGREIEGPCSIKVDCAGNDHGQRCQERPDPKADRNFSY